MKKNGFSLIIMLVLAMVGYFGFKNYLLKRQNTTTPLTPSLISSSAPNASSDNENETSLKWQRLKNSTKFVQCYQSKKDLDQKTNELLPRYKEILNREKENLSVQLSIEDQYIKTVYGWVEARGGDYSIFKNIIDEGVPSDNGIAGMERLLNFIYCPDVSKIPISYPLTVNGCKELLLTWMAPFEYPVPGAFKLTEEYNLALEKFKANQINHMESVQKCCNGENTGLGCTNLPSFVK